jgi:hypothetical protein
MSAQQQRLSSVRLFYVALFRFPSNVAAACSFTAEDDCRQVAGLAVVSSAVAARVSALTSGVVGLAVVGAFGFPAADADFQPVVEPFAFLAGAFARAARVPGRVAVASFDAPVGACAPTPRRGCLAEADLGDSG